MQVDFQGDDVVVTKDGIITVLRNLSDEELLVLGKTLASEGQRRITENTVWDVESILAREG